MNAPSDRNWHAVEDGMPPGLRVEGEVETNNGSIVPTLTDKVPQGTNPAILMLDLTLVDTGGGGTTDIKHRPVKKYQKNVSRHQYETVEILWEGKRIASMKVEFVE